MSKKIGRPKKVEPVVVRITFGDKTLRGEGKTVLEALEAITPPVHIFTKGTIKVSDGNKEVERTWFPVRMKRAFRKSSRGFVAKELSYLMK